MNANIEPVAKAARFTRALAAAVAAAVATQPAWGGVSSNTSAGAPNTQNSRPTDTGNNPAVTISLSGSTAIRNFTTGAGPTLLEPGTSITLLNGPVIGGVQQTTTYTATNNGATSLQLANLNFTSVDSPQPLSWSSVSGADQQVHSAIRLEWHEQGSVEGILDMVNDQIGYAGGAGGTPIVDPVTRNPIFTGGAAFGNPIWVNQNVFNGTTAPGAGGKSVGNSVGTGSTLNGFVLNNSDYNTYSNATYNPATGQNLQGGQNRVQLGISDVNHVQGFSVSGANGSVGLTSQTAGYGKGNNNIGLNASPAVLPDHSLATPGSSYQLRDQTILNMPTTNLDPQTGANYAAGAWNTAGLGNLVSHRVAATATLFVANPGTGLTRVNSTDAQFLQTSGRLQNGVTFNMTTRDVGSGTRNTIANNTGVDPSWAVGANDAGNGADVVAGQDAQSQLNIGGATNTTASGQPGALAAQLFSNKTAGGQLRSTVQNNRWGIGTLSISDTVSQSKDNTVNRPLRSLQYADTAGHGASAPYVQASAASITGADASGNPVPQYVLYQNEQYVTVKAPDAQYGTASPNIKGDNSNHDVASFQSNILNSVAQFPNASVANPADQLLQNALVPPQLMAQEKNVDGINQSQANPGYNAVLHNAFVGSTALTTKFAVADPTTVSAGSSSTYGNAGNNVVGTSASDKIAISAVGSFATGGQPDKGNYLAGNFNQNGIRDFSAIQSGQAAQAALAATGMGTSAFTGGANSSKVAGLSAPLANMPGQTGTFDGSGNATTSAGASKGDLIVMGDVNGDGKFDGQDLYLMARGAAVADTAAGTTLTLQAGEADFGDMVRRGVLVKNGALDWMQSHTTAQQKLDARASSANDPAGANAFNKFDVNRDGLVSRNDAAIVDKFIGSDFAKLSDQLVATINTNGTIAAGPQKPISLVDVNLIDGKTQINRSDFNLIAANLEALGKLTPGDVNLDGVTDNNDIRAILNNFGNVSSVTLSHWTGGDTNGDGVVDNNDLRSVLNDFGSVGAALAAYKADNLAGFGVAYEGGQFVAVPESTSVALLAVAGLLLARRRRQA